MKTCHNCGFKHSENDCPKCENFDYDLEDDEEPGDPDYYTCGCGYSCVTNHGGWGCPKCGAIMEEAYY